MNEIFEFFFELLILIWQNIDSLLKPLFSFLLKFTDYFVGALIKLLSWALGAIDGIVNGITAIFKFFG